MVVWVGMDAGNTADPFRSSDSIGVYAIATLLIVAFAPGFA
jgi:hypothetical protein